MKITIAMPAAHANVKMHAMQTVVDTALALRGQGHEVELQAAAFSEIVWARNYLASYALDRGASHLFFIDSDMYFPPEVSLKLLAADTPVIGAIYPRRQIALEQVIALARRDPAMPAAQAIAKGMEYTLRVRPGAVLTFQDGAAEVLGVGMGATMIQTGALRAMIEAKAAPLTRPRAGVGFPVYGFFDPLRDEEGADLSEDFSFCARWIGCGGAVHALEAPRVGHVGDFTYRGSFSDSLR